MNPILVPSSAEFLPLPALEATLVHLCETAKWDYGEIWIPAATGNVLELHPTAYITAARNPATTIALEQFWDCTRGLVFPPNVGLPGRVWVSQRAEWLADATAPSEREFLRHYIAKALGVKTGLGIPVLIDRRVVAVFVFFVTSLRQPEPGAIEWMTATAAQVETHLENRFQPI